MERIPASEQRDVRFRNWDLQQADKWLLKARLICPLAVQKRSDYADVEFGRCLQTAYDFYLKAGLGILAGRVRWLARQRKNVVKAWITFDKLNRSPGDLV